MKIGKPLRLLKVEPLTSPVPPRPEKTDAPEPVQTKAAGTPR